MSAALNADARTALRNAGISPKEWAKIQGQPDGKWHGDRCGCNDDRCIGYHHDESDACGCLPALLEWHWRDLAANAHEGGGMTNQVCASNFHNPPTPAPVHGTYALGQQVWYCEPCAKMAETVGLFTRDTDAR